MLEMIKRWLGRSASTAPTAAANARQRSFPASATGQVLSNGQKNKAKAAGAAKPDQSFDPYNTGKFDRSASWERMSNNRR
jgi:hypothetical protein